MRCPHCDSSEKALNKLSDGSFLCDVCGYRFKPRKSDNSQKILSRILRMQCLGFQFKPVPCGDRLCAYFEHPDWGAFGEAYHEDMAAAVFEASKKALRHLAERKRAHMRACKEAATVFTEHDPEKGLL